MTHARASCRWTTTAAACASMGLRAAPSTTLHGRLEERDEWHGAEGTMGEGAEGMNIFEMAAELLRRHPRKVAFAVVVLVFAWFAWPTPYRAIGPGGTMQINRFTDVTCRVGESCWLRRPESEDPRPGRTIRPRSGTRL